MEKKGSIPIVTPFLYHLRKLNKLVILAVIGRGGIVQIKTRKLSPVKIYNFIDVLIHNQNIINMTLLVSDRSQEYAKEG